VARAISGINFKTQGVLFEFYKPRLDFTEMQGANCKMVGIFPGADLFFNGKSQWTQSTICGPLRHRFTVDRPWPAEGGSPELSLATALGHGGSPEVAQRGEGCTGSPFRASPGHGWQCGGRVTVVKKWRRRRSVRLALGHREKRRRAGRGAVEDGEALPLYRG
jgi:hypothetical protein